jgi:hypothetical protein
MGLAIKGEIMFYIIVILAAIFAMPAKADETLKYRIVQHAASTQNQHTLGLVRSPGIVFFSDGSTGTSSTIGTFDAVIGVEGTVDGYSLVNFVDGSELWLKYTGTSKTDAKGQITLKGTAIVIGGKGRYAGAKGDATWETHQNQSVTLPGDSMAYYDNVINLKK